MKSSIKRSLKCRQVDSTLIQLRITGTGTPAASGLDSSLVSSITDNGVGDWTIILKDVAQRDLAIAGIHAVTAGLDAKVSAITSSSVRVLMKTYAGVATDGIFDISVIHSNGADLI